MMKKMTEMPEPPLSRPSASLPGWAGWAQSLQPLSRVNTDATSPSPISEPPTFVRELPPVDVVKGSSALCECEIAGTSPFEVTWHKDGKEIKPSAKHGFSILNGTVALEVHKCDPSDVGEYQCTAANEVGSCTCKTTLSLKGRFPLQSQVLNVIVLGKMAEFQCAVTGSPTFSVQWQKDDSWIMEDPKMERTFENNVATLRIPACEAMHSGRYTCQVSNEAGQDKCSASLIVQGKLCFAITAAVEHVNRRDVGKQGGLTSRQQPHPQLLLLCRTTSFF
uniref:Ig-like domain-containing protein n=1 Tax=Oryzias latipes TaxID=8090 RepID=A0A3P9J2G0_ORYLA